MKSAKSKPPSPPAPPPPTDEKPANASAVTLPDSEPPAPLEAGKRESGWSKLWRLTESNFFMGGGVGMAIAAYAFLIGGAPRFAVFLLVVSWLVMAVSIYRHNFFEGRSGRIQLIGETLVSLCVALALALLWAALRPDPSLQAEDVGRRPDSPALATSSPMASPASTQTPQLSEAQLARTEFRNEATRPVRDVAVNVKLNRSYSIQELGHFRILYVISDNVETPEFYLGCQDLYRENTVNRSVDPTVKQFGINYTARYRASKDSNTYVAIPVYTRSPKYSGILSASQWVDTLGFSLDLYNQIPTLKTVEDLNRKVLHIYVTAPLIDKISEISFTVNNYQLVSGKIDSLMFTEDKPSVGWFKPLSNDERAVQWRGVFQKATGEIAKTLGVREVAVQWSLDFGVIDPKKLPEPKTDDSFLK